MAALGLRSLVGANGWDYCILWKLSKDQRFLECMTCCCSGAGGQLLFPVDCIVSIVVQPCRDVMFHHPRTRACDALSEIPFSIPLDPFHCDRAKRKNYSNSVHAQVFLSNQPKWLTSSHKTRVLVPVLCGLVELFVSRQVVEDPDIINIVMSQCNTSPYDHDQQQAQAILEDIDGVGVGVDYTTKSNNTSYQPHPAWLPHPQPMSTDPSSYPWDLSADNQSRLYSSPLDLFSGSKTSADVFFEGSSSAIDSMIGNNIQEMAAYHHQSVLLPATAPSTRHSSVSRELGGQEKDLAKHDNSRQADSGEEEGSDQGGDDDDPRGIGRSGKRHHSKNLVAERKRRKKLNDRLYALRSLVPKITKMDRASILGDAIEYVLELQKQVKDLQDELEETNPEDEGAKQNGSNMEMPPNPNAMEHDDSPNSSRMMATNTKTVNNHELLGNDDLAHQMEPQVEVKQLDEDEFYVKVLCEQKLGGFTRLMEAVISLGLEVTNVNVASYQSLVLSVFRVKRRENNNEAVQAEEVRDSLLELTRNPNHNPNSGWPEGGQAMENVVVAGEQNHYNPHHMLNYIHHQP